MTKWIKQMSRKHSVQRVSFLWRFISEGIPQDRSIHMPQLLILPGDGEYDYYFDEDSWDTSMRMMAGYIMKRGVEQHDAEFREQMGNLTGIAKEVYRVDLSGWTDEKLLGWYNRFLDAYSFFVLYPLSPWAVDHVLSPRLQKALLEIDPEKAGAWLDVIATPTRMNQFAQQQVMLYQLAKEDKNLKPVVEKYAWLSVYSPGDALWTEKEFRKQLEGVDPASELERIDALWKERKQRFDKVIQEIPEDVRPLALMVNHYVFFRDERIDEWRKVMHYITQFYEEVAKRANLATDDILNMLNEEIVDYLEKRDIPKDVEMRKVRHAVIFKDRIQIITDRSEIDRLKKSVSQAVSEAISGTVAFKGKVVGRVASISKAEDVDKVKDGYILVAAHTRPEYMVAMRKASAIVTDEGGITCHAAIVSRELGIPCVIGTKIATQVLKDGDKVEVDADSGTVRILDNI